MDNRPIGIFDSGIGGLTVVREILMHLPNESLIYLGDTARVPYGTRDNETIKKFADELVSFMVKRRVKAIVVACNTMSAVALPEIKKRAGNIPVIDVISPTVDHVFKQRVANGIGVIGTRATINSGAYQLQLKRKNEAIKVISIACPLFVPLVEEGFIENEATDIIAQDYLQELNENKIDSLILGCTHYPMLVKVIRKVLKDDCEIINSGVPTAKKLNEVLTQLSMLSINKPEYNFYVTDIHPRMRETIDRIFVNNFPGNIEKIDL